jgi:hypothetical protein
MLVLRLFCMAALPWKRYVNMLRAVRPIRPNNDLLFSQVKVPEEVAHDLRSPFGSIVVTAPADY